MGGARRGEAGRGGSEAGRRGAVQLGGDPFHFDTHMTKPIVLDAPSEARIYSIICKQNQGRQCAVDERLASG